jgi:hypothetical protein
MDKPRRRGTAGVSESRCPGEACTLYGHLQPGPAAHKVYSNTNKTS